jgi:EAL domain-containing protein (putative c-di-GMP-specific phosphodiesterase class I)/CheY-like chemotaxis protein
MRILLVDDDPFIHTLLTRQLRSLGVDDVFACGSAADAIRLMNDVQPGFDILVCDLNMPGMDGVELIRHLAWSGFSGGVVLLSGEDERTLGTVGDLANERHLRVLGAVQKPVSIEQLQQILDRSNAAATTGVHLAQRKTYAPGELRSAIDSGQIVNHYQPQVDLRSGRLVGVETLARWQHPQDGLVYPDQFIATAERNGLMDALTRVVLETTLEQAARWRRLGIEPVLAVNVSMDNLVALDFPDAIISALTAAAVPASRLVLEITESQLMQTRAVVLDITTRLRLKRIGLSIDDFGTGFSSLAQLRDIPFQEMKLDRSFVHNARHTHALRAIVETNIGLARQLGMHVVAEGVENQDDWEYVRTAGCDRAQGYFIARPMAGDVFPHWLRDWDQRRETLCPHR